MSVNPQSKEADFRMCESCHEMYPDDVEIHCKTEAVKILTDLIESTPEGIKQDMALAALEYLAELANK